MRGNSRGGDVTAISRAGPVLPAIGVPQFRDSLAAVRVAMTSRLQAVDVLLTGLSAQQETLVAILTKAYPTCEAAGGSPPAR